MQGRAPDSIRIRVTEGIGMLGLAISIGLITYAAQKRKGSKKEEGETVTMQSGQGSNSVQPPPLPPLQSAPPGASLQFDLLRSLRVEVQALQSLFADIRAGLTSRNRSEEWIQQRVSRGECLMQKIEAIGGRSGLDDPNERKKDKKDKKKTGDAVEPFVEWASIFYLRDMWERIKASPLVTASQVNASLKPEEQVHHLTLLDTHCRQIVFEVGYSTIPKVLDGWLAASHVGYYIPFHAVFEDEVPVPEDRTKILNYLALSPKVVREGLFDVANGLVYHFSAKRPWQWASLLTLMMAFVLASVFVALVAHLYKGIPALHIPAQQIAQLPTSTDQESNLLIGWGALFAGVMIHLAVATAKRMQSQASAPPVIAVGNLLPLINAKLGPILLKLVLALLGFFGLVFATGASNVTLLNFFLTGYTLDSVVELFGATAEQRAGAQVAALKQQLSGAGSKGA